MGCRLHAVKTYVKEFADGDAFNWQQDNVSDTFSAYDVCVQENWTEDGCGSLEIYQEDWEKFLHDFEEDKGKKSKIEDYTYEEQLAFFKKTPICSDDCVHFEWF